MEWSKTTISKAELEKKQREYMEAALNMAKRAGKAAVTADDAVTKEEIVEEIVEEIDDLSGVLEEIKEKSEEITEPAEEITEQTDEMAEQIADIEEEAAEEKESNEQFGVFNAEELVNAIESGEVSGEGLKQAAEILEEMTRKTETMRKLVEEQESEEDLEDGSDYGLNGFVNRHNSNCRGCGYESDTQSP